MASGGDDHSFSGFQFALALIPPERAKVQEPQLRIGWSVSSTYSVPAVCT